MKKKIAITMGDAGGIGPEVAVKTAFSKDVRNHCNPTLIGDKKVLEEAARLSGLTITGGETEIIEPFKVAHFTKGAPSGETGVASFHYIKYAVERCLDGDFHAMVTAPISKEALREAGFSWPGHTEMLAELTSTSRFAMMLAGGPLRVILVTTHLPLRDVPGRITSELIYEKIELAFEGCTMLGIEDPVVAVAGLNPHAGEGGIFGKEELEVIKPAVHKAREDGLSVVGPVPPDVVYRLAYTGKVDIVVAMYHDQGLIPLKMIAFERGVNITIGLPVIRTSPDHGTAYDIAWKGIANPESMTEAVMTACRISLPG
jgi:4-hydroxythreonine-4-phosphate dehydrogenase